MIELAWSDIMRVISGKYKGKKLDGFDIDGTRPTMDRVKESLFAMIQNKLTGSKCLDLFAGSGALGIEALSNNACLCVFIDNNKEAIKTLKSNMSSLTDNINILFIDYKKYLKMTEDKFDIIFLDPPYKTKQLNKAIQIIEQNNILEDGGLLVCEYEVEEPISNYKLIKEKKYGNKMIKIFEK